MAAPSTVCSTESCSTAPVTAVMASARPAVAGVRSWRSSAAVQHVDRADDARCSGGTTWSYGTAGSPVTSGPQPDQPAEPVLDALQRRPRGRVQLAGAAQRVDHLVDLAVGLAVARSPARRGRRSGSPATNSVDSSRSWRSALAAPATWSRTSTSRLLRPSSAAWSASSAMRSTPSASASSAGTRPTTDQLPGQRPVPRVQPLGPAGSGLDAGHNISLTVADTDPRNCRTPATDSLRGWAGRAALHRRWMAGSGLRARGASAWGRSVAPSVGGRSGRVSGRIVRASPAPDTRPG